MCYIAGQEGASTFEMEPSEQRDTKVALQMGSEGRDKCDIASKGHQVGK